MPPQTAPAGFPESARGGVAAVQDQGRTARNAKPVDPIRTTHKCQRIVVRGFDRDLIRGGHYGQRSCNRAKKPNTWLHRPSLQT